jgi:hypothetical protein
VSITPCIIVDTGSQTWKSRLSAGKSPTVLVSPVVGFPKELFGPDPNDYYIGDEVLSWEMSRSNPVQFRPLTPIKEIGANFEYMNIRFALSSFQLTTAFIASHGDTADAKFHEITTFAFQSDTLVVRYVTWNR